MDAAPEATSTGSIRPGPRGSWVTHRVRVVLASRPHAVRRCYSIWLTSRAAPVDAEVAIAA